MPSGTTSSNRFVNRMYSETPRMISGTTNDSSIMKFAAARGPAVPPVDPDREQRARAAPRSSTVMIDELEASAPSPCGSRVVQERVGRVGRPPPQREPLPGAAGPAGVERERRPRSRTGSSDHSEVAAIVVACRKRGLRHGLRKYRDDPPRRAWPELDGGAHACSACSLGLAQVVEHRDRARSPTGSGRATPARVDPPVASSLLRDQVAEHRCLRSMPSRSFV